MITILYTVFSITIAALLFSKEIHQSNKLFYSIAIVVAIFTTSHIPNVVNTGYVPIAFFIVVLFSGLLEKNSIRKRLFTVRAELAIIGSILMFPHAYGYLEYYLGDLQGSTLTISFVLGLSAYVLMIPLTITSFQKIRRKMGYKTWKALHKTAYIFFFLVGLHVILIANENQLLYTILFTFYFSMRFIAMVQVKHAKQKKLNPVHTT